MPALSRDRILDAAVALADREGFEAATLRRIAAELGVHVTSLYHHVATRDAVVDAMVERLMGEADLPLEPVGWEQWVRRFVAAVADVAAKHPGAFAALSERPVQGEAAARTFEVALAAFAKAGLSPLDAYGAVKATSMLALGIAGESALQAAGLTRETAIDQLPVDRFPEVHKLEDVTDVEASWAFAVDTLVSGLRSQIRKR